jgi:cell wall-associated NlpC family hydrolase
MILQLKTLAIALVAFMFIHVSPAHAKQTKQEKRTRVAQIAKRYLGVHYVWGGSTPHGFDCSGLVRYVFAIMNIKLPHHAASQYNYGRSINKNNLKPGDLIFFNYLGHVGIYIGNNKFIHAPRTGDVVKISSVNSHSGYYGARRII